MSLILTILIDAIAAGLFVYHSLAADQVITLFACVIQLVLFIDILAVMLLRNKQPKSMEDEADSVEVEAESTSRRKRKKGKVAPTWQTWLIRLSVIINFAGLLFYAYKLFIFFK